jgi:hypothetical protein
MSVRIAKVKPKSRRIRALWINTELLLDFWRQLDGIRIHKTVTPIPDDARIVWVFVDDVYGVVKIYVESQEFDEVPEGQYPPEWDLEVQVWTPPVARS